MEFRLLGPLEVIDNGLPVAFGARQRALLAVLLVHANEVISANRLIDAVWRGKPPVTAQTALHVHVSQLRKLLGVERIETRPPGYRLVVGVGELDSARFERLLAERRAEDALALWRGRALAEFESEPWAASEAARLQELRLAAEEEWIEALLRRGGSPVAELEWLVREQPLRERRRGQLMRALYGVGRQADALAVFQQTRTTLIEELGIEPGRALQELEQAILRQDPALELTQSNSPVTVPPAAPVRALTATPGEPSAGPDEVREERKIVSVLFIQAVGVMPRAAQADPEDLRAVLRPFRAAARREVERFGGTVESYIGDMVIAVFGAPAAHEDDPERALRATLAIRSWVSDMGGELQVRMAVTTGAALVSFGARSHDAAMLAAGDVVDTAQRLLVAAPVNGILVGEPTYRATRKAIDYRRAAPVEAEGMPKAIAAWEVAGARPRLGADLVGEPTAPFVGRERELDLLISVFARAAGERSPQLVTLVGVPGIGKTRLVFEFSGALERDHERIAWLQGRCLPYGDGVSFWALGEIVKAQAGILESDSSEQAAQKLRRAVAEVLTEEDGAPWVERELQPLVGAGGDPGLAEYPGEGFAAWRRFLEGLAERNPLVLVLEDLQWADEALLGFADEVVDRLREVPLLVVCTARPELLVRRPGWGGGKANALTISLPPLSDDETAQLVAAVMERPLSAAGVDERLLTRAAGNPLYAEQFARVLMETGSLEELPETVHGIIAARLDGLLPPEKALLQAAAVVGKVFWLGAIVSMSGIPHRQADELLFGLKRKEFVQQARRSSVAGEAEYAFRHVLIRDVAYAQIPRAVRGERHRRAAEWIESLGRPEDHAEMLAHHYSSALKYDKAAGRKDPALAARARHALRAAGDRALALASYAVAARFYQHALELWPGSDPEHAWLLVDAGRAWHGADGGGIDLLEQGFGDLCAGGDSDGAAEVAVEIARRFWVGGDRDPAYAYIDRALNLTEGCDNSRARAYALVERAGYHMSASEYMQGIRLARQALPLTEALDIDDLHVRALDVLGGCRASAGDVGGLDESKQAIALARERNAFSRLIIAELNLHTSLLELGQVAAAWEALRVTCPDVEGYGTADQRNWLRAAEAHQAVLHGRWDEAARILDERLGEADAGIRHYSDPSCHALRASIALARGDLEASSADSEKALERARQMKDPQILAPALALRAIVLVAQRRPEEASRLVSEVLARGRVLVPALMQFLPTVTPIEFAWLLRDLGREPELLPALRSAPATPWLETARATAHGDLARGLELAHAIGAPSVAAYSRLRSAEALARLGRPVEANKQLAPAVDFFRKVGAARYLAHAQDLLSAST
jgi:DNA-binding SARP family transcriptional activator/tetratricopeptide (TPR) repeat protein